MKLLISSTSHLNNAGYFYASYNGLTKDRQAAVDKYRNTPDKFRSIVAGELLTDAFLDSHPLLSKEDIGNVNTASHGKPYLQNFPDWNYNLSHSGDYAAIAYDDIPYSMSRVGLDIQKERQISESVARRILTDSEYNALPDDTFPLLRQYVLNALWSAKEAYIKFTGRGLSLSMNTFYVDNIEDITQKIRAQADEYIQSGDPLPADNKSFYSLDINNNACNPILFTIKNPSGDYPDGICRYYSFLTGYHITVCTE